MKQTAKIAKDVLGVDLDSSDIANFDGQVGKHGRTFPDMT